MATLYGRWKVSLPHEEYTFEPDEMLLSEWDEVEQAYGGTFEEWIDGISDERAAASRVLVWWLRRKNGLAIELDQVDFKIRQLTFRRIKDDPDPEDEAATSTSVAATSEPSPAEAGDPVTSTA